MKRFELLRRGTPDLPHFECGPFNHLGTSPYISVCFILKKFLERKAGENTEKYSIFDFENPLKSRISGGRNDQTAVKFRVSPVMTTSIPLHVFSSTEKREEKPDSAQRVSPIIPIIPYSLRVLYRSFPGLSIKPCWFFKIFCRFSNGALPTAKAIRVQPFQKPYISLLCFSSQAMASTRQHFCVLPLPKQKISSFQVGNFRRNCVF